MADYVKTSVTRYCTYHMLKRLNNLAVIMAYNRSLYFERLPIENESDVFPVLPQMLHAYPSGAAIRCMIVLNKEGSVATLDIPYKEFLTLPVAPVSMEEQLVDMEFREEIDCEDHE